MSHGKVIMCKSSWERLCECQTSVTCVCMCCDKVTINKKHKLYIYIYIYIYISNWRIGYTAIYSYTVNVNLMLICIELLKM